MRRMVFGGANVIRQAYDKDMHSDLNRIEKAAGIEVEPPSIPGG